MFNSDCGILSPLVSMSIRTNDIEEIVWGMLKLKKKKKKKKRMSQDCAWDL